MRNGQGDPQEAQPATVIQQSDEATRSDARETSAHPKPERVRGHRGAWVRFRLPALFAVFLLACLLITLLTDSGRTTASKTTFKPTPSPTATVKPTPTTLPGFSLYTDNNDGFGIQYPRTWVLSPLSPGIQFDDANTNPGFEVQLLVPGSDTCSSTSSTATSSDATVWVNCTLSILATKFHGNFEQAPGPTADVQIGQMSWQSGVALLGQDQSRVRVQVYATIHQGKPYIINLLAVDSRFSFGMLEYFQPMLQSFKFLPTAP
jgi:hypothetical protein